MRSLKPQEAEKEIAFPPSGADEREEALRTIRKRRGQPAYRDALRSRYHDQCVVTGCTLVDVLEAAHIAPYRRAKDNHPDNGLLLRADIHTLFDLDLLGIEPDSLYIYLHPKARSAYPNLHQSCLMLEGAHPPSKDALLERWKRFQERIEAETG